MTEIWVLEVYPVANAGRDEVIADLQKFLMRKFGVKAVVKAKLREC